jgi:L-amino acid N-acyltransferase YncA
LLDDDSDGSDEVLFRQNERNQIAGRPKPPPLRLERPSETAAKERDSDQQVPTDKADPGSSPAKSTNPENKPSNDSKTTDAAQTCGCLVQQPGRNKRVVRQKTPEEVQAQLDELRRLQQEQIINLGYKRRGIEPNEDPFKSLKLARQGPGAERDSPFSLELARLTGPEGKSQKIPYYAEANHSAVDGEPVLLRERTDAVVLSPGYDSSEYGDAAEPGKSGTVLVDWMYRDWTKGKDPSCVEKFRNWLDAMSKPTIAVDMSQQAFLDGSLHSDGVSGMIGMELPDVDTYPDTSPASREHRHETAAGYNHNWIQRLRKEEEESRKKARRTTTHTVAAVVKEPEPMRNPNAPKANIYLRPVEPKDIPQLVAIFNWHVKNSTCVLELENITEDEMRGHIEECEQEDLPFIVAAELLPGIRYAENGHKELIYGYILAVDFTGANTINRFTAELELLVNPATRKQGVGKCLVDKVLDILDPRYSRKGGYHFDYPANKRQVYGSCRGRQMAKVLFAVPYPSDKDSEYVWLKSWLVDKFRFEEQGILRGIGVKGNQV